MKSATASAFVAFIDPPDQVNLPGLAGVVRQLTGGGSAAYQLNGAIGVDAGRLGQPTFGPMRLATGEFRIAGIRQRFG